MTLNSFDLTKAEFDLAAECANAYRADHFVPYLNDLGQLCVICDPAEPTQDGFLYMEGLWFEFDPDETDIDVANLPRRGS